MLFSIAVFTAGSAICGASVNMAMLIAARGIQGLGAGGLFACVYIIVSDVVNLRDRGKYQGYIGSMWGLATIVGPLLGGVFTDKASWRWAFYSGLERHRERIIERMTDSNPVRFLPTVNIPFAIIAATIVFIYVKLPPSTKTYKEAIGRIDFVGMIAIIGSSAFILLALELGGREGWGSPMVISFFVIGPVLAGIFVFWENKYAKEPVIAMQLFKIPNFSFAMITAFLINIPFYATGMYLPLFFQVVSGYSAIQSGLMTLPNMLSSVFAVITSGILVSKYGRYVEFTKVGCLLVTIAMPVMAIWNQYTNLGVEIVSMLINGEFQEERKYILMSFLTHAAARVRSLSSKRRRPRPHPPNARHGRPMRRPTQRHRLGYLGHRLYPLPRRRHRSRHFRCGFEPSCRSGFTCGVSGRLASRIQSLRGREQDFDVAAAISGSDGRGVRARIVDFLLDRDGGVGLGVWV